MQLVLISGQYKVLQKKLETLNSITVEIETIKAPYIYFNVSTSLSQEQVIQSIKREIYKDRKTKSIDFQIYGFYQGKIDYVGYMSAEQKEKLAYYQKK